MMMDHDDILWCWIMMVMMDDWFLTDLRLNHELLLGSW